MWQRDVDRLALLELHASGQLRLRTSQADAWRWLSELPWTRFTGRRDELALVEDRREDLEHLLDQVWPAWRDAPARLAAAGLPVTERGWRELLDRERVAGVRDLPLRLNLRTATAQVAPHSKASLSMTRREALADIDVTRDGVVRMRPQGGLVVVRGATTFAAADLAGVLGELVMTERAFTDGTQFGGNRPRAVLLVENLGPYLDLDQPRDWLVVHVPGWNTATVRVLLDRICPPARTLTRAAASPSIPPGRRVGAPGGPDGKDGSRTACGGAWRIAQVDRGGGARGARGSGGERRERQRVREAAGDRAAAVAVVA